MSCLLTSGGNLSLPYRTNSTNNSFERLEMALGGKISLKPLNSSRLLHNTGKTVGNVPCARHHRLQDTSGLLYH